MFEGHWFFVSVSYLISFALLFFLLFSSIAKNISVARKEKKLSKISQLK
jgi:hypothetical protein